MPSLGHFAVTYTKPDHPTIYLSGLVLDFGFVKHPDRKKQNNKVCVVGPLGAHAPAARLLRPRYHTLSIPLDYLAARVVPAPCKSSGHALVSVFCLIEK